MSFFTSRRIYNLIVILLLTSVFFYLGFGEQFFVGPHGIHYMRQTDSLSFASQFYNSGYDFFHPALFNLKNGNGNAACEFPITYYLTSIFYGLFGKNYYFLKLIHVIILYIGIYLIIQVAKQVLKDGVYAIILGFTLFTSTIFNYYSFNYLPDIAALGFTFIGWYFAQEYFKNQQTKTVITAFSFFTLGGLIKVTYLINPFTIIVFALFQLIRKNKIFPSNFLKKILLIGFISTLLVFLWNAYMLYYNSKNNATTFNTKALPIWDIDQQEISIVIDHITEYWYNSYFYPSTFHLLLILCIVSIVFYKKRAGNLSVLTAILFAGSSAFFILFFAQFKDHDYYFMTFLPFFLLLLIHGIKTFSNLTHNFFMHSITKIVLIVLVIKGINYAKDGLAIRFQTVKDIYSDAGLSVRENEKGLQALNIPAKATCIISTDLCPNGALYEINRMGWTVEDTTDFTTKNIRDYQKLGADYIVLISTMDKQLKTADSIGKQIYRRNNFHVYKLPKKNKL